MKKLVLVTLGVMVAATLASLAYVTLQGSTVVSDSTEHVVSAVATNGEVQQHMYRIGSVHFGIQRVEGVLEVRCKDGTKLAVSYITSAVQMRAKVRGCAAREVREWIGFPWGPDRTTVLSGD